MSTNTGLIPFFVRKLEPDWNIFAVLNGSLQISSQRPWKVLLLLSVIGGNFPDSVCYCDIELFYLKDPQRKCDVFCAIIEFRNLKGGWAPFCGRMSMSARHHHVRSAHGTMQSHHSRS
ncbi:uncharacterized protein EURHEDRAFT_449754 [Aspergillus ruber CBS 135680]|uniref:Uncharacterized protein n=1 Tax=Aspergillus ruber (strain CBS 135680) TaxID=1388766 RepID=A0A017SNI1_ASPRC|nr:uncharacterized protein EURHEDRAFT_449754 [Aspergillus ruber CBS 135680]EYE97835.1 hypothetical protein EURHEDRAFT_449754 [Aspergillus ruber CBS 135680]